MFLGPLPIWDNPSVCVSHSVNTFEEYRPVILQHGPHLGLSRVSPCLDAVYAFLVVWVARATKTKYHRLGG